MNEEFVQFPTSNDEGKKPDEDFEQFLSGLSDDDETLDFASLTDQPADGQSENQPEPAVEAEEPAAGGYSIEEENEPLTVNSEWSLPEDAPIKHDEQPDDAPDTDRTSALPEEPAAVPPQEPAGEPFEVDAWLADQKLEGNYHSLLILKGSKTWKYTGGLSETDIREVERILAESKNPRAIDMARYARLGAAQQKYLLYTTSISGSLILCSVNYAYRQLSEIRSQTRETANQLSLNEDQVTIPEVVEAQKVEEVETAHKPVKLETGEAAQVMLDDLLRGPVRPGEKDELFSENDGWVFESSEITDAASSATGPVVVDGQPITTPETLTGDTQPLKVAGAEPVIIPKGGYGKANIGKPVFGKLYHLTEEEAAGRDGLNILKTAFRGIRKADAGQPSPKMADRINEKFSDWSPAYTDLLANRARLKNRKTVKYVKGWRPAPPVEPNLAGGSFANEVPTTDYQAAVTEDSDVLPVTEAWPPFETEETLPDLADEFRPEDTDQQTPRIEIETQVTVPVDEAEKLSNASQLTPPETLDGVDLSAGLPAIEEDELLEETPAIADSLLGTEPAERLDTPEPLQSAEPADFRAVVFEEDQVFLDETSDFLKELTQEGDLDGIDHEQDATAFFEDYFKRSGEIIEQEETDLRGEPAGGIEEFIHLEEAAPAGETAVVDDTAPETTLETTGIEMEALSAAAEEIYTKSPDTEELPASDMPDMEDTPGADAAAGLTADFLPEIETAELEAAAGTPDEPIIPDLSSTGDTAAPDQETEIFPSQETAENITPQSLDGQPKPAETSAETASQAPFENDQLLNDLIFSADGEEDFGPKAGPDALPSSDSSDETIGTFDIDEDYNKMIIAMQERMSAFDRSVQFRAEEETGQGTPHKPGTPQADEQTETGQSWMSLRRDEEIPAAPAESTGEPSNDGVETEAGAQDDLDIHSIISSALTGDEPDAASNQAAQSAGTPAGGDEQSLDLGSLFNDDLFPWEVEGDARDILEATPTPRAPSAGHADDDLVDLLSDTSLDPVHLGFDQPMYTCILVPELGEYSLTSEISAKIREWLPRLSRVFGWQFEDIHIQPTYLQWTVRVPVGTSQGSIVRKVRQQTSLRIFETFPELKRFSPEGNFWAKGYLVVAGSNPPPAEFLEDFIQKNRKPSDFLD